VQIQTAIINSHNGVTVKDVPAKDFIEAFAKHLKKGNKIKMPEVRNHQCWLTFVGAYVFLFSFSN